MMSSAEHRESSSARAYARAALTRRHAAGALAEAPLTREAPAESAGFTLLEVLLAVFVFGTVMTTLVALTAQNMDALSTAKNDLTATALGEGMMRRMLGEFETGKLPEIGVTVGDVEIATPSNDDGELGALDEEPARAAGPPYRYRLEIEPYTVPLPEGAPAVDPVNLSTLFLAPGARSSSSQGAAGGPSTLRVTLRIHAAAEDPEEVDPFVMLLTEPAQPAEAGTGGGTGDGGDGSGATDGSSGAGARSSRGRAAGRDATRGGPPGTDQQSLQNLLRQSNGQRR
jgi:type II secretory pathway pseudopilin PulG